MPFPAPSIYQLAFCTPGRAPARACNRKLYCEECQPSYPTQATRRSSQCPSKANTQTQVLPLVAPRGRKRKPKTKKNRAGPYPRHLEVPEDTPSLSSEQAPVPDLGRVRVAVHLRELELGLGAHARGERGVPDDVAEGLSVPARVSLLLSAHAPPSFFPSFHSKTPLP